MAVSLEPKPTYAQMPIFKSKSYVPDTELIMGLAFQRDDESANIFRRVGLTRWMIRSAFNRLGLTDFTLVQCKLSLLAEAYSINYKSAASWK